MDERRFRLYVALIVGVFAFTFVRLITETNPIYQFGEPLFARLNEFASEISLSKDSYDAPSSAVRTQNETLVEENELLRAELDLKQERQTQSAEVTRRDLLSYRKFVWINIGESDGIMRGQTVLHQNALFGVVDEVYSRSSLVQTVLDPEFRATVAAGGEQGLLKSESGSLLLDLIPSKTLDDEAVVTNGLSGRVEAGVDVGRSDQLISNNSSVFGTYNVLLPYSLYDVQFVQVIQSEGVAQ